MNAFDTVMVQEPRQERICACRRVHIDLLYNCNYMLGRVATSSQTRNPVAGVDIQNAQVQGQRRLCFRHHDNLLRTPG